MILRNHFVFYGQIFLKNDDAFLDHLVNPPVSDYLEAHAILCDWDLSIEFYGTFGDKVIAVLNESVHTFKVFKRHMGYGRV